MTEYSFEGVHLLPNNPYWYRQRTYAAEGIEIEAPIVYLCDACGNRLSDITSYFTFTTFEDPQTGLTQIEWDLLNVNFDAGYRLVYLEIQSGADDFVYSSPFYLTNYNKDFTAQFWYKNRDNDNMLSIGLLTYFRQHLSEMVVSKYNPVSSNYAIPGATKIIPYEKWTFGVADYEIFEEFKKMFLCRYLYSKPTNFGDKLPVSTIPYDAFESIELEADENFGEKDFLLTRNLLKEYDPLYIAPVPPPPPPPVYTLTLQMAYGSPTQVNYVFEYSGFTPVEFLFQYSTDGVTWTSQIGGITSPFSLTLPSYRSVNYKYRVVHQATGTTSNVATYPIPLLNLYPTNGAAYSVSRRIRAEHTGPLIWVRRADGVTQTIGFTEPEGNLDTAALLTFSAGQTCTVFQLIDQSGNALHLTQTEVARQPVIVDSGVLVTENGQPAIRFDGVNDYLEVPGSTNKFIQLHSDKAMVSFVGRVGTSDNPVPQYALVDTGGSIHTNIGYYLQTLNSVESPKALFSYAGNGVERTFVNGQGNTFDLFNTQIIVTDLIDNANPVLADRGKLKWNDEPTLAINIASGTPTSANSTKTFKVGVAHRVGAQLINYLSGTVQEVIVYLNDQTANELDIRANINNYYEIY